MKPLRSHPGIVPKKHLGQNFLHDPHTRNRIIESCGLSPNDTIVEIGPGLGVLTQEIAPRVKHLYAIEKDAQLSKELEQKFANQNVTVIRGDILKHDLGSLPHPIKIIGNLPYYISSPIIEKVLTAQPQPTDIFITVQLEFGQRLVAKVNTRDYSALSCFAQYHADVKILFKISKACFTPIPKVESCFIHLKPRPPLAQSQDTELLFQLVRHAFQQRRKKLENALTSLIDKEALKKILVQAKIDGQLRPENISLDSYVNLANVVRELKGKRAGE
jgi:16S rRNA (adenine1518-N6/adenine1519-N6)-dimethyltransferase